MQLTRAADYAMRVMIHLAGMPVGSRVSREALAQEAEVPAEYLGKVLQALGRAELIQSHRGATGGFQLHRPGEEVTALEVVEAIEGPLCLNLCLAAGDRCGRSAWCGGHELWLEAQEAMARVLRGATVASLAERTKARRSREVQSWN